MSLNKALLIGRLAIDPEQKLLQSGHTVVNINLVTNRYRKDKDDLPEYHRLVFWDKLAEIVMRYCYKGMQIYVEGELQTRSWDGDDGKKRYMTEIVCHNMQMLGKKQERPNQTIEGQQFVHQEPEKKGFQNNQRQYNDESLEDD